MPMFNYLGRYIKRHPIADSKLKHYDGNNVIFKGLSKCKQLLHEKLKFNKYYTKWQIISVKRLF